MELILDHPWLLSLLMTLLLTGVIEIGNQTAVHLRIEEDSNRRQEIVAIRDGLFVLIGLLLGFTMALAAPHFAERRALLIDEANAIGTTYMRAATLPQPTRDQAQQLLRRYVDARLEFDSSGLDDARQKRAIDLAKQIQEQLWEGVIEVTRNDPSSFGGAYMNSLNETIDLHEKRVSSLENRIPRSVWVLIFSVSIIATFARGLTLTRRFWLTLVLSPLTIALVVGLIADLDTPRSGWIQLDQRPMQRLKADINHQN